jgi:hypothetical protein
MFPIENDSTGNTSNKSKQQNEKKEKEQQIKKTKAKKLKTVTFNPELENYEDSKTKERHYSVGHRQGPVETLEEEENPLTLMSPRDRKNTIEAGNFTEFYNSPIKQDDKPIPSHPTSDKYSVAEEEDYSINLPKGSEYRSLKQVLKTKQKKNSKNSSGDKFLIKKSKNSHKKFSKKISTKDQKCFYPN